MKSKLDVMVSIATLIAAVLVSVLLVGQWIQARRSQEARSPVRQYVSDVADSAETSVVSVQRRKGHSQTVLVEFSDFQCPYCGSYARSTYPLIERDFVNTKKVEYWFRHLPLDSHPLARVAAVAAQCAEEQNRFWPMHDRLFRNQAALEPDDLVVHADRVGLDIGNFHRCMAVGRADIVERDRDEAKRLGVMTTPTFFVGTLNTDGTRAVLKRVINGSQPYATFKSELERAIGSIGKATN